MVLENAHLISGDVYCQISDLIKAMIEQLTKPEILNDSFIGKWSDDAELQLIEDMLKHRS